MGAITRVCVCFLCVCVRVCVHVLHLLTLLLLFATFVFFCLPYLKYECIHTRERARRTLSPSHTPNLSRIHSVKRFSAQIISSQLLCLNLYACPTIWVTRTTYFSNFNQASERKKWRWQQQQQTEEPIDAHIWIKYMHIYAARFEFSSLFHIFCLIVRKVKNTNFDCYLW